MYVEVSLRFWSWPSILFEEDVHYWFVGVAGLVSSGNLLVSLSRLLIVAGRLQVHDTMASFYVSAEDLNSLTQ